MPYKTKELRQAFRQKLMAEKHKFLIELKRNAPCTDCGQVYPHYMMEWDHVPERGKKLYNVSSLGSSPGAPSWLEELAKCDLVCANCHNERTYSRRFHCD